MEGDYLKWDQFSESSRYIVSMEQKDTNGTFSSYRFNRELGIEKFDLSLLEEGYEYRLTITPKVNENYDAKKAVTIYVSVVNDIPKVSTSPINETKEVKVIDTSTPLPKGFTYNESTDTLSWEKFADSSYYRISLEQKQSNGNFTTFGYDRTTTNQTYKANLLKEGYVYKITVVPRDSKYQFRHDKAISFYVKYENGKKVFSQTGNFENVTTNKNEDVTQPQPTSEYTESKANQDAQNTSIPSGITYKESTHLIEWVAVENSNRYKVAVKVKNSNGTYTASANYNITAAKFSLDTLTKNKEYSISIIPYVGGKYDSTKAYNLYANTKTYKISGVN